MTPSTVSTNPLPFNYRRMCTPSISSFARSASVTMTYAHARRAGPMTSSPESAHTFLSSPTPTISPACNYSGRPRSTRPVGVCSTVMPTSWGHWMQYASVFSGCLHYAPSKKEIAEAFQDTGIKWDPIVLLCIFERFCSQAKVLCVVNSTCGN